MEVYVDFEFFYDRVKELPGFEEESIRMTSKCQRMLDHNVLDTMFEDSSTRNMFKEKLQDAAACHTEPESHFKIAHALFSAEFRSYRKAFRAILKTGLCKTSLQEWDEDHLILYFTDEQHSEDFFPIGAIIMEPPPPAADVQAFLNKASKASKAA